MPVRSCNGCTACCTVMGIEELNKPLGVPCWELCKDGSGCSIYASKPPSCNEFECVWLTDKQGLLFNDEDRPDKVGLMFDHSYAATPTAEAIVKACEGRIAIVREVWPGAFREPKAVALLKRLAPFTVIILVKGGTANDTSEARAIMGPEHLVKEIHRLVGKTYPLRIIK
jgi:hypothetical protein